MMDKNIKIYTRNIKTLLFVFLTPIFFLTFLQLLQNLSNFYNSSIVVKDHSPIPVDSVNLSCLNNTYGKYDKACISIGIAIIVK
jgi:hypothetical protein